MKMFSKCYGCFCGFTKCNPAKNRIARKQKKQLKKYLQSPVAEMIHTYEEFSLCDLRAAYVASKQKFQLFKRFYNEISLIKDVITKAGLAPLFINQEGRLCWQWESDCDVTGGSTGIMPFCYSKEEAGGTWAFDEVFDLLRYLCKSWDLKFPKSIKSDIQLLKYIKSNNPILLDWNEYDELPL